MNNIESSLDPSSSVPTNNPESEQKKQTKEYEQESRPDNSFLMVFEQRFNLSEKVLKLIPPFITNRTLMHTGFIAACLTGLSFFLTTFNKTWFLSAAFFLLVFLFCDRYDGRIARAKGVISKRGYFADHMFDGLSLFIFFVGLGFSPGMRLSIALGIVLFYYILAINTFLMTYITGTFATTYYRFSPAEAILILVIVCVISFLLPYPYIVFQTNIRGLEEVTLLDLLGTIFMILFAALAISATIKNFFFVERFEKRYPADTIWMYLRKRQLVKNEYVDQILDDLDKLFNNKK
ncbi:MAG: CDP-alcohol phosphatidyltransferase family protein [Patescibacteria group bacterium]|nr:CDP-alcohol phosphatidyltransferase family protein [Patescibacteria group bacterium]MDD5121416.1 CDP-alcohol phosphatidyltransferase family protein [Patescibacteria group bacterium]MDD5221858.1 CDP-alcohol phosphatidyltransferase family protein [Patescibacteria group bacterium]MDD5395665.1 CDP-alcohol phosphatidyltransferase family protein [Patescibacteria group bacterium]